jgi:putative nucleotidyltransferase with HDIG domain
MLLTHACHCSTITNLQGQAPMNEKDLILLKDWFADYCVHFSSHVEEDQRNFAVKKDHTYHVCLNALRISRSLQLNSQDMLLAEAIALFHDVGRFPQYQQYKTFDDDISANHAALGAKVLLEQDVLRGLPEQEQNLILHAVTLHNVFTLPDTLDQRMRLFAHIVRDADKLDIWRVFIEYYEQDEESRASAVALGLPDVPGYSPTVLACLNQGRMARKSELKTLNDFKLLQLTWLYDLNFTRSLQMVQERGYVDNMAAVLPTNAEIREAVERARTFVTGKLKTR